jgi:hypothetical protein
VQKPAANREVVGLLEQLEDEVLEAVKVERGNRSYARYRKV